MISGKHEADEDPSLEFNGYRRYCMLVSVLNSISILVVILQQKEYFKTLGFLNVKKSLFWIDFSYIIVNLLVGIYMFEFWLQGYGDYINDIKNQRYLNCAGIFLIYLKG